jgi:tetratricopeptide (TPR) repeat protein
MNVLDDLDEVSVRAQEAYDRGEYLKAADSFHSLVQQLTLSGEEKKAAEMANNCCVAFLKAGKPGLAFKAIDGKERIFEQTGDCHYLAITIGNRGAAHEALGMIDEAINDYRESAQIFKNNEDQELFTSTIQAISSLQLRKGRLREAVVTLQSGLDQFQDNHLIRKIINTLLDLPIKALNS